MSLPRAARTAEGSDLPSLGIPRAPNEGPCSFLRTRAGRTGAEPSQPRWSRRYPVTRSRTSRWWFRSASLIDTG